MSAYEEIQEEILKWSKGRLNWQRDALRRLVSNGELTDSDIKELFALCKKAHGLSEPALDATSLSRKDFPEMSKEDGRIIFDSIYHTEGVNRIAEKQTLELGEKLTLIYGENGSGKSGYTRIFKQACHARGGEKILPDISSESPKAPKYEIRYHTDTDRESRQWKKGEKLQAAVYDRHTEKFYLTERMDIPFRPFGLDLLDRLADACKKVSELIDQDIKNEKRPRNLSWETLPDDFKDTEARKFLLSISKSTSLEELKKLDVKLKALTVLSEEEKEGLSRLDKRLLDMTKEDPEKQKKNLRARANHLEQLEKILGEIDEVLSDKKVKQLFSLQKNSRGKASVANKNFQEKILEDGFLKGTGFDPWKELWRAAEKFSKFYGRDFPETSVTKDSRCPLCQQNLLQDVVEQLRRFGDLVHSEEERESQKASREYEEARKQIGECVAKEDEARKIVRIWCDERLSEEIMISLQKAKTRREAIAEKLKKADEGNRVFCGDDDLSESLPLYLSKKDELKKCIGDLNDRIGKLKKLSYSDEIKDIKKKHNELKARQILSEKEDLVRSEIKHREKIFAYKKCISDTNTRAITEKSKFLAEEFIIEEVRKSFADTFRELNPGHLEIEFRSDGGEKGISYHRVGFKDIPNSPPVPEIISEGEGRCTSIVAFLAELSATGGKSAVILDDPVSSLDHGWCEKIAELLVKEAKNRQVIVLTHDILFLMSLYRCAEKEAVEYINQHLRCSGTESGICENTLPWVAMLVKERIGLLKNEYQCIEKICRDDESSDECRTKIKSLYGSLRETWERAVEEILLNGAIERFSPAIQTNRLKRVFENTGAGITHEDYKKIEEGMTECSRYTGHDGAPAQGDKPPSCDELGDAIEHLVAWVKDIRRRRK